MGYMDNSNPIEIRIEDAETRLYLTPPVGFTGQQPITIYKDREGVGTDFDVSVFDPSLLLTSPKTYYVKMTGSDAADGLTPATALRSISVAAAKSDVDIIIVYAGIYTRAFGIGAITRTMAIKAYPGDTVTISAHDNLTWTLAAAQTNTYQATRTGTGRFFDSTNLDANGDYIELTLQASIANVEANANSYFISGSIVYIRTFDTRSLIGDTGIRVMLNVQSGCQHTGNKVIYLEGLRIEGGQYPLRSDNTAVLLRPEVYAKNCTFKYGSLGNGVSLNGAKGYFQGCIAAKNLDDGFNYHMLNAITPDHIEVGCIGRSNGISGDTDNGSTTHEGLKIIRVNGSYYNNIGPNVADVNDTTQSWNIGCVAHDSASAGAQDTDFTGDGASKTWLDSCTSYGSTYSLDARAGSNIYVRNSVAGSPNSAVGTISAY